MSSMNTMNRFEWADADSVESAIAMLKGKDGAAVKAGGVDLLDLMKEGIAKPPRLVNIRNIKGLDFIEADEKGIRIGPLATMATGTDERAMTLLTQPRESAKYPNTMPSVSREISDRMPLQASATSSVVLARISIASPWSVLVLFDSWSSSLSSRYSRSA